MKLHIEFETEDEFDNPPYPALFAHSVERLITTSKSSPDEYTFNTSWLFSVANVLLEIVRYREVQYNHHGNIGYAQQIKGEDNE